MRMTKEEAAAIAGKIADNRAKCDKYYQCMKNANSEGAFERATRYANRVVELDAELKGIQYVLFAGDYEARKIGGKWCVMAKSTWDALYSIKGRAVD